MKLTKPDSLEKKELLAHLVVISACFKVISTRLLGKRLISKAQCLQYCIAFCKEKSIPCEDTLFSMAFNAAWGEIATFSPSKGDRLTLLESEVKSLTGRKRFHNYVVTIVNYLTWSDKEIRFQQVTDMARVKGKNQCDAFELAFAFLHAELEEVCETE